MYRFTFFLATIATCATPAFGADTFASQLRDIKHIGLSVDKDLAAFTLYAYTPMQYAEHVASLAAFQRDHELFKERIRGYDRERQEAMNRRATADEHNAITKKSNLEYSNQPQSPFERRIKLTTVISVGDDYITLSPLEEPAQKLLIPLGRVGRLIVSAPEEAASVSSKAD